MTPRLVLASASPRRHELLALLDRPFDVEVATVDESPRAGEDAEALVRRLARTKARAVHRDGQVTVGADTVVVLDGRLLGKPVDAADALGMLEELAGHHHEVLTGVAVLGGGPEEVFTERTRVWMAPASATELRTYVATGEPLDKAGAYGIQARGGRFVARIDGSYHNVVGLPVAALAPRLAARLDR